ncbi:MAG: ABC transporter permease [Mycobacteriales bacterium]
MNGAALALRQVGYEQRSFWRNPASAVFTFAFPLMFLFIFGSLNQGSHIAFLANLPYDQYYVPGILAYGIMSACYSNLATELTLRREAGILKRLRATPLPAWAAFTGLLGNSLVISVLLSALAGSAGVIFYHVRFPGHWPALLTAIAVGVACFGALGVAVSTLVPNADAGPPVVNLIFFLLLFLSGTFFPLKPHSALARLSGYFPVRHLNAAIFTAFDPLLPHGAAHGFDWSDLRVVVIWAIIGVLVAIRRWRWVPRRR